jgi:hypothetical protein
LIHNDVNDLRTLGQNAKRSVHVASTSRHNTRVIGLREDNKASVTASAFTHSAGTDRPRKRRKSH